MPSRVEQDKDRDNRLREWFKGKPQAWDDIRSVIETCETNAHNSLLSIGCVQRDVYVGKCIMAAEIIGDMEGYKK